MDEQNESKANRAGIFDGITIGENGSISSQDARKIRLKLRLLIIDDTQKFSILVEEIIADSQKFSELSDKIERLQERIADWATMEFAVQDLSDPNKEF